MIKLGLVGKDIAHSRSQAMYEKILGQDVDYHLLDYAIEHSIPKLDDLFSQGFLGLSVTYPYKQLFLDDVVIVEADIKQLGAINCIRRIGEVFEATNTDYLAADWLLKNEYSRYKNFLILGSGNMSRVFESLLSKSSQSYQMVSRKRNGELNSLDYTSLLSSNESSLVINCCSREFVFKASLPEGTGFWDMNYSFPAHNHLKNESIKYYEGLDLLEWQAKFALKFWEIVLPRNS